MPTLHTPLRSALLTALLATCSATGLPTIALAQDAADATPPMAPPSDGSARRDRVPPALEHLMATEPTAAQVLLEAERHLGLRLQDIRALRRSARRRAAAPLVAVGGRLTSTVFQGDQLVQPTNFQTADDRRTSDLSGNVGVLWDLRDLAFNSAEMDAYALLDLRRRLLMEVSRAYLARRLLQIDLHLDDPDLRARLLMEARIGEYTAVIDAMTGGWFAERLDGSADADTDDEGDDDDAR